MSHLNTPTFTSTQQRIVTGSDQSPSHLLQKQESNFCPRSDSDHFPVEAIIESEFQRYSKMQEKRSVTNNQSKRQSTINRDMNGSVNRSPNNTKPSTQCYIDWKVYKSKPDLNMLPFPYCIEQAPQYKKLPNSPLSLFNPFRPQQPQSTSQYKKSSEPLPKLYKLKIQNKVKIYNDKEKENKVYRPYFNFEKTPINEYLNYELAQEINNGLREVQIVAEEIKRIKKAKKMASQDDRNLEDKYSKGVRIRRSYMKDYKGLYKTNPNVS